MDADLELLIRQERVAEAAHLASERGDHATASVLYERACDFRSAAIEAGRAENWERTLELAPNDAGEPGASGKPSEPGNPGANAEPSEPGGAGEPNVGVYVERAFRALERSGERARGCAEKLGARGRHAWAARLFHAAGETTKAARAYERAAKPIDAARLFEEEGSVVDAGRVLEAAARRTPDDAAVHLALGELLLRYGKVEHAVRVLQRVGEAAAERRRALTRLSEAFGALGLDDARAAVDDELAHRGGPESDAREAAAIPRTIAAKRLFGRYEIAKEVASSPSARVFECRDPIRDEPVAVKLFSAQDTRGQGRDAFVRFEREARAMGTLAHPNVVPLRDYVPEGPALVMAWMNGGSLADRLARALPTPRRAVEIAQAVLLALAEAHRLGILHRDVKPANVLFDDAGVARLADFGVAHLGDRSATATAGVIGTIRYMSPEQREGRPATAASDLFGVGALLFEMLTGDVPDARAPGMPDSATAIATAPTPLPSDVHDELDDRHDAVVRAAIATSPSDRPESALAFRHALASLAWPDTEPRRRVHRKVETRTDPTELARLACPDASSATNVWLDRWLDRRVVVVPLDDVSLARASAFARADHPALQTVLRVDHDARTIWLAEPRGAPLRGALTETQATLLREALARLHAEGDVHGHVDADHVVVDTDAMPVLRMATHPDAQASADHDRRGLDRLEKARP